MEFKKVTREWDTLKKTQWSAQKMLLRWSRKGKLLMLKIQLLCWKL